MFLLRKRWRRVFIALGSIFGCLTVYGMADYTLRRTTLTAQAPSFTTGPYKPEQPWVVVFDGFIGHPQYRLSETAKLGAYEGYNVLYVNPSRPLYGLEAITNATLARLKTYDAQRLVVQGGSMGAKAAYRLLQQIESDPGYNPEIIKLLLLDPLHDGSGVRLATAKIIRAIPWRPGPMTNWLLSRGDLLGKLLVPGKASNNHQRYGRSVPASLAWDQAREAAGPAVVGALENIPPVTIIHCDFSDDEILYGEGQIGAWRKIFGEAKVLAIPKGLTHHMGADTEPTVWAQFIKAGLAA